MTALARRLEAGSANARQNAARSEERARAPRSPVARLAVPPEAAPAKIPAQAMKPRLTPAAAFGVAAALLLILGWLLPTERYITPKRGLGYSLGIIGGSMMLLLFLYSARKRVRWLAWMGAVDRWFRFHMVLGILGPLCILFHSNYSPGATNSNAALFSMLAVAGSGLVGRYIYARVVRGVDGHGDTLEALRSSAVGLRAVAVRIMPELVTRLEHSEQRLLLAGPRLPILGIAKPALLLLLASGERWRLRRYIRAALRAAARHSAVIAGQRERLHRSACTYVDRRLAATRRLAGFKIYERLFSLWHAVHVPLLFMLLVAGVVHVIAVHVY